MVHTAQHNVLMRPLPARAWNGLLQIIRARPEEASVNTIDAIKAPHFQGLVRSVHGAHCNDLNSVLYCFVCLDSIMTIIL